MVLMNSRECKVIYHVALLLSYPPPISIYPRYLSLPPVQATHQLLSSSSSSSPISLYSPPSCFHVRVWSDLKSCPPLGIIRRKRLLLLSDAVAVNGLTAKYTTHLQAKRGYLSELVSVCIVHQPDEPVNVYYWSLCWWFHGWRLWLSPSTNNKYSRYCTTASLK